MFRRVCDCMFFSYDGKAVKIPVEDKKVLKVGITEMLFFKKTQEKKYHKRCLVSRFRHVCLLNDNVPSHTSDLVKQILKSKKVTSLLHPTYSLNLAQCGFFLFPKPFQKSISRFKLCISSGEEDFEGMRCSFHFVICCGRNLFKIN